MSYDEIAAAQLEESNAANALARAIARAYDAKARRLMLQRDRHNYSGARRKRATAEIIFLSSKASNAGMTALNMMESGLWRRLFG